MGWILASQKVQVYQSNQKNVLNIWLNEHCAKVCMG